MKLRLTIPTGNETVSLSHSLYEAAATKAQGLSQGTSQPTTIYNAIQSPPTPTRPSSSCKCILHLDYTTRFLQVT